MPRFGSSPLAFPDFKGAARRLTLLNLAAYFVLLVATFASSSALRIASLLVFDPYAFMHGALWQPITYSFVHRPDAIFGTLLELLSIWILAGFLEAFHDANWVTSLYAISVLGTAAAALVLYLVSSTLAPSLLLNANPLYGCFGGIFGLLVAIGVLYGDTQFLMLFVIGIKARHMAIIYAIVAVAMLFGEERMYAFALLGGALAGFAFVRMAPRRGFSFMVSESWYGMRNRYYRWKRRRAARKFEVYMRSQGRTVKFDGQGNRIDEDADDKKRWN